jgi:hypothetical protein
MSNDHNDDDAGDAGNALANALRSVMEDSSQAYQKSSLQPREQMRKLAEAHLSFHKGHGFAAGEFVRGKAGIASSLIRNWDSPHIVFEVIPPRIPSITPRSAGDPYAGFTYDMVVGVIHSDGSVIPYLTDSRLWEPYPDADKLRKDS